MLYLNHYKCSVCGCEWTDEWDCMCDDRCPECDTSISPNMSEELCAECTKTKDECPYGMCAPEEYECPNEKKKEKV